MRVVSGKYRGKKLKEFELSSTRPTLDRVKESIFNLIQFSVSDAMVLDLFSGTGALGIEAISRGAKEVVFVDKNKLAIEIINQNLKGVDGNYKVLNQDYSQFLSANKTKFDIVLLDPPYATDYGVDAIDKIIKNDILNESGIIIFETSENRVFNFDYTDFEITKKKYGTVSVYKFVKVK